MLRVLVFLVSLGARAIRTMCRRWADLMIEHLADTAPRYLIFDRDSIFSSTVVEFIKAMGTKSVRISYRGPWQ